MSEEISLASAISSAVSEYFGSAEDSSMVTGFIIAVSTIDTDGQQGIGVAYPETQGFHQSLGLLGFAEEYIRDDIRMTFEEMRGEL